MHWKPPPVSTRALPQLGLGLATHIRILKDAGRSLHNTKQKIVQIVLEVFQLLSLMFHWNLKTAYNLNQVLQKQTKGGTVKSWYIWCEVFSAVVICWDISLLKVNWHFRGTSHLSLQGWRICQASLLLICYMMMTDVLLSLTFSPNDEGNMYNWHITWLSTD
jgi:hypothetical protein